MSKVYIINKDNMRYIRIVSGEFAELMQLDYQNSTLDDLRKLATGVFNKLIEAGTEEGKKLKKHCGDKVGFHYSGHSITLANGGNSKEFLFSICDAAFPLDD